MAWYWWLLLSAFAWTFGAYQVGQFRRRVWRKGISTGFWPRFFFPLAAKNERIFPLRGHIGYHAAGDTYAKLIEDDDVSDDSYGWYMVALLLPLTAGALLYFGLFRPMQQLISLPQRLRRKFQAQAQAQVLEAAPSPEDGNRILERIASLERELDQLKQQLKLNPPAAAYRGELPAHDPKKN
ncbi:MAG TPA: hypothetical protein VFQ60_03870 [Patescibacteria group bacterium]|nr:hypothetical protein [Patescibacteria group bacterium]